MRDAKLRPINPMIGLDFAQLGAQTMTQLRDGDRRRLREVFEDRWGRRIAEQIKSVSQQSERRFAGKELRSDKRLQSAIR